MITIIDYGMSNLRSVEKAFKRLDVPVVITSKAEEVLKADKLVLPGVGNFRSGMNNLKELGMIDTLNKRVLEDRIPILGICLGMQLFTLHSEEGDADGLGWIDATTKRFRFEKGISLKVPHIGWNTANANDNSRLFTHAVKDEPYYFVHSYYVNCEDRSKAAATSHYGIDFDSSIEKDNIIGVQFHPEKSHDDGILLLKNFIELY